ncbi:MAG: VanZ family protein [Oscillospiraceae bacterium]|nr:VanZ family protein [Oscillospiraceae bacterium]
MSKIQKQSKQAILTTILFAAYLLALVWLILFKLYPVIHGIAFGVRSVNLIPFYSSGGWSEVWENFAAFIPFGLFIGVLKPKWSLWNKLLPILCTSLAFELIQLAAGIGRSDITDLISNVLGGLLGIGIYALLLRFFGHKANTAVLIIILIFALIPLFVIGTIVLGRLGIRQVLR